MKLFRLMEEIDVLNVSGDTGGEVLDICYDSRKCGKDSLFVAITGLKFDGHDYVSEAVKRGAKHIVHERDVPQEPGITFIRVGDSRRALGKLGKKFYNNPTTELCLIGVTGTNGKTTVTYFLESILRAAGFRVGVIGTINYRFNGKVFQSDITTPESVDLQRIFRDMVEAGITHVVAEVSSHALDFKRVDDCEHDIGIFTNLSQDHLDYHHTIENYYLAKKRFFQEILKEGKKMIINVDDPWGRRIIHEMGTTGITFGIENQCDIYADEYDISLNGISAKIKTSRGSFSMSSPMTGKFNLYNILAAASAATMLNVSEKNIKTGIEALRRVPGRFEKVSKENEPAVFVDYAHTDDALKSVLENLSYFKTNKVITVFGCGGDRDRGKRPLMGKAASELSDLAIVTSDNPRTEDPLEIISEIEGGIKESSIRKYNSEDLSKGFNERGYIIIPDREEAINLAVSVADPLDIILIAGKGHEDYQIIGERKIPFDDVSVTQKALAKHRFRRMR